MRINQKDLLVALRYILAIARTTLPIRGYVRKPLSHIDHSRKTALIVSHEASRTGAPILALNLARRLKAHYNIVSLLLADGPLTKDFMQVSNAVFCLHPQARILAPWLVRVACSHTKFDVAFVNSAVSAPVLPFLAKLSIPTVTLVHEFTSYAAAFMETLLRWSSRIVFSTRMTHEDAIHHFPLWHANDKTHILPQGRSVAGAEGTDIDFNTRALELSPGEKLIVGLGHVQLRKGCDLFIQCAQKITKLSPNDKYRFLWIGGGFDPKTDLGYSTYLAEQIRRSGLATKVYFLDEMNSLDEVYRKANLLLLTSRLDPLPNVGIDAICLGIPIVVFKDATGLSDILIENGLGIPCVAPHLDAAAMAELALNILHDNDHQHTVKTRLRTIGKATFDMDSYVTSLLDIASLATEDTKREETDIATIINKGEFDLKWWRKDGIRRRASLKTSVRTYLKDSASGLGRRGPNARFDPEKYRQVHKTEGDAYAAFLNSGRPFGPWQT